MQPYPGHRRWWAACVLASLLLHLLCLWSVERWLAQTSGEERVALQLPSSSQHPFKLKERLALPPDKHAFSPRPSFRSTARQPRDLFPGAGHGYLERGVATGLESQAISTPSASYDNADTLVAHLDWEHTALQAWQDSVEVLLTRREPEKEDRPLDPLAAALEAGRTLVELDPVTGELVRAQWYVPVYRGEGGAQALRRTLQRITQGVDLPPRRETPFRKPTDPLWQAVPLFGDLVGYHLSPPPGEQTPAVPFDPIHRFGMFPYREVLDAEALRKYLVILLEQIDAKDGPALADYLLGGGYVITGQQQLGTVEAALRTHLAQGLSQSDLDRQTLAEIERLEIREDDPRYQEYYQRLYETQTHKELDARVQRIDIWSGHPLLEAYYSLRTFYPTGHGGDPPLRGLEVDGRLVAVAVCRVFHDPLGTMIFANEVIFGLMQPSELGGRYTSR